MVHNEVKKQHGGEGEGDSEKKGKQAVRGESLRELQRFLKDNDQDATYSGLRRIGDNEGT